MKILRIIQNLRKIRNWVQQRIILEKCASKNKNGIPLFIMSIKNLFFLLSVDTKYIRYANDTPLIADSKGN